MPKRTYQPSKIRKARTLGFRKSMESRAKRKIIGARRKKGRKVLTR